MGQITLLNPTKADAAAVIADASRYKSVIISASALVGEAVTLKQISGGTPVVVADPATAVAVELTALIPAVRLEGGAVYVVDKPTTVSDCGLYMDTGPAINS